MTPAVDAIRNLDIPKSSLGLHCCGKRMTMHDTEESALVAQFNAFLMSRLYPWRYPCPVKAPSVVLVRHAISETDQGRRPRPHQRHRSGNAEP